MTSNEHIVLLVEDREEDEGADPGARRDVVEEGVEDGELLAHGREVTTAPRAGARVRVLGPDSECGVGWRPTSPQVNDP